MVQIVATVNLNAIPGKNYNPRPSVPSGTVGSFAQQEFSGQELEKIRSDPFLAARIEAASQRIQPSGYTDNYKGSARNADARQAYNLATRDYSTFLKQELPAYINNQAATQQIISKLSSLGESPQSLVNLYNSSYAEKDRYAKTEGQLYDERKSASSGLARVISPYVSIGLSLFAPGIGSAIGASLGLTGAAAAIVGNAIVQGSLSEAQGGDFLDGAIKGAVTAGVAPAVANTVGSTVVNVMADSAVKNVVANAIASSAASAVTAALTGGDVESAALTGALAGAGGSIGREFATAADLGTTPFSEQTQMLAGQEQGLGTAGGLGANIGQAAGAIAAGTDADQAILQALAQAAAEKQASTPKTVEENITQTPVSPPPGEEITTVPPPETGQITDTGVMDGVAGTIPEITPPSTQEIPIPDQISQELGGVQEGVAGTIPPLDQDLLDLITQPTEQPDFGVQEGIAGTIPEDLGLQEGIAGTIPEEDTGVQEGIAGTIPEEDTGLQEGIVGTIPEEDTGIMEGIAGTIPEGNYFTQETVAPYIRDIYISGGRRQPIMGPTVTTLGQALSAPFFPSSPVSGLTSYRGAGEIESKATGKPRRDVWNEASLRLKDALGL